MKDWLKQKGIDYIYIEPFPDLSLQDDASAMARYRKLFTAQIGGNYDAYAEKSSSDYERRVAAGAYADGVTVTPKPAEAAKLVALLQKQSGGGDGSDKSDYKGDKNKGSAIRKAIDRFKDALSKVKLAGLGLQKGRKSIKDADPNLQETENDQGRHEWKDTKGRVRVRYDPKGKHMDAQWDKNAPDGTPIDNAGRPVPRNADGSYDRSQHIPAQ